MKGLIKERTLQEAVYMVETRQTIREVARVFGVSKSTVHIDLSKRLKVLDEKRFEKVKEILDENFAQKHIRGGQATKERFSQQCSQTGQEKGRTKN